ncbi:hypothetical protein [Bacteriovorax sp. BAL6_X]|uniref:hypothetical protein n=1 Tax=Bacteriovorax sp. BAL6_X TaxID=1201290 RepID=UPI0012EE3A55|nr:hypothetical protein [Bacteriovorax sp. BAL6_X]
MGIEFKIENSKFNEVETLDFQVPNVNLKISDELSGSCDIFLSRYETLVNIKYLKDNRTNHLIGSSPCLEDEITNIISYLTKQKPNNFESRINSKKSNKVTINLEKEFDQKCNILLKGIDLKDYHDSFENKLKLITNEFYTNDIFHRLSTQKHGEIEISQDEYKTIVHYKSYTRVAKSSIIDSLYRAAIEKTPRQEGRGAGLGLYLIFQNCDRLHIVANEDSTSFYLYIEKNKRYKEISKRIPSISFYNLKD